MNARTLTNTLAGILAAHCAALAAADIRLNEVYFAVNPAVPGDHQWVELVNLDPAPISVGAWWLRAHDGGVADTLRGLPPITIPPGAYLVVHFAPGVNDLDLSDGRGDYYTADPAGTLVFGTDSGDCGLYDGGGIVDYVAWHRGPAGFVPGWAHAHAVAAMIWTAGEYCDVSRFATEFFDAVRTIDPGQSIGRDGDSTDTNTPKDWDTDGGRQGNGQSPGARNYVDLLFLQDLDAPGGGVAEGGIASGNTWTVMLYLDGDNDLEKYAYAHINLIEKAGGSTANVRFVCLVDGIGQTKKAVLQNGQVNISSDPPGAPFRFRIVDDSNDTFVKISPVGGDTLPLAEVNMADPGTLSSFIAWSKTNFPADKYALILFEHGGGWKGVCLDDTSNVGGKRDALFMGELRDGLANGLGSTKLELLVFNACLMGMIEVAYQVQPYTKYVVFSEQVMQVQVDYNDNTNRQALVTTPWITQLRNNPQWDGDAAGKRMVELFDEDWKNMNDRTASCIKTADLPELVGAVSALAGGLRAGCDDFQKHDIRRDNVEEIIRTCAEKATRFHDKNYMDLHDFAKRIKASAIPAQYKVRIDDVLRLSAPGGPVVVRERHGSAYGSGAKSTAHGLTIHFPLIRTYGSPTDRKSSYGDAYDYPALSRVSDANSKRAGYAGNVDDLPLQARDVETEAVLAAPTDWPLVPSPNFKFPEDTQWDEFLQRFYHPVSDNKIVKAVCPECRGKVVELTNRDYPGVDEIKIWPGCTVFFTGKGSSDADTSERTGEHPPRHYMWDFDHATNGCTACKAPWEVANAADAASANDDMNADQDIGKDPLNDEKEADSQDTSRTYNELRDYIVTLNVWDDNDHFRFHDTRPTARYVHPQTDDHTSIVRLVECPEPIRPPTVPPRPSSTVQARNATAMSYVVVDDFRPLQNATVSKVHYYGAYDCSTQPTDSFVVRYYQSAAGGLPGALMAEFSQGAGSLSLISQRTNLLVAGVADEYEYVAEHAPISVTAQQCYWIEISNALVGNSCRWYWEDGLDGNGHSLQAPVGAVLSYDYIATSDRAFALDVELGVGMQSTCLPPPPFNDECAAAPLLSEGAVISVDTTFATTSIDDPRPSCMNTFQRLATATVWYRFVANGSRARLQTCDLPADTMLTVLEGDCASWHEIACNDDACGQSSDLCVSGLTPGETYYVMLSAYGDSDRGVFSLALTSPCVLLPTACCLADGSCAQLPASDCATIGGIDLGEETTCAIGGDSYVFESQEGPLPIPDGSPAGVSSTLFAHIENPQPIHGISVDVSIPDHTWVSDLIIRLERDGVTADLWNRSCGSRDGLIVTFGDGAPPLVCGSPTVGSFAPATPLSPLAEMGMNGPWTLSVVDVFAADSGTLTGWSLTLTAPAAACAQPQACCLPDGSCFMAAPAFCSGSGGVAKGDGSSCAPGICPLAGQACCLPIGGCMPATPVACAEAGGLLTGPSCEVAPCAPCMLGDGNCDGTVNNFDIDPFVVGVVFGLPGTPPPPQYLALGASPECWERRSCWGDIDGSGLFNNFDIDPFVACIIAGESPCVPH
ncbi:MAG: hypothetical protein HRU75_00695 [Planctomycetia bacterium]|nr:MAG: hypothetical protein HRU75_00695 [Planctomycetia bacterium]